QTFEARGEAQAAHDLREAAFDAATADTGRLNDEPFTWCADADTRLGPVLEMIINGEYHWIAMADIARLEINPPKDLRDLVWSVCILTLSNGGMLPVMMPTRYPGASESGDAQQMLARKTDFRPLSGEHVAGMGQRMLVTDTTDVPFLEVRSLEYDNALASSLAAAATEDG
ncbi:MAG: type VI secretion system accessory protein TagJ, partial [Paracoccaceae bacterium]